MRTAFVAAALVVVPVSVRAQAACSSCEDCTTQLASANAEVTLANDLALRGEGPCVVMRGEGVRFNGGGHIVLAQPRGGVGVRIEAARAGLRSLRVTGADTGVVVAAAEVTLYNLIVEARGVGIRAEAAPGVRVDRVRVTGGHVGVSFGANPDGTCPATSVTRSPGAVVVGSTITRADTGLAACDARPVLTGNIVRNNGVGVLLGDPSASGAHGDAPWDPCVCQPGLDRLRPGMLAMFSSGCAGCEVHEGWMSSLRRRGVDVRVRETGPAAAQAQQRFDAWAWRCAPGMMDSLGIPGCVPNYTCTATGAVSKRRQGERELVVDTPLNAEDDVARFSQQCAAAARGRYAQGARCVVAALADNTFCNNRAVDVRATGDAARWGGLRNRCGHAESWSEATHTGCTATCDGVMPEPDPVVADPMPPPAPTPPPASTISPSIAARQSLAQVPVRSTALPPTAAPATGDSGNGPLWLVAGFAALLGAAALLTRKAR